MSKPVPTNLTPTPFAECYPDTVEDWEDVFGFAMPVSFGNDEAEYNAVRNGAAAMEFSLLSKWDLQGPGAIDTVNKVFTRDVSKLKPGQIAYGAVTNDQGKMLDDCTVCVYGPEHVRVFGVAPEVEASLQANLPGDTSLADLRPELAQLSVQGPNSRKILQAMTDTDLSNAALPYYHFLTDISLAGINTQVSRMGFTAELGFEILMDVGEARTFWDALFDAGRDHGLLPGSSSTVMTVRLEAGMMMGGLEYDDTVTPFDCRLGWAVDLDKDDFQGRDALVKAKDNSKVTVVSVVVSDGEAYFGESVSLDGDEVGTITMAFPSPYLNGKVLGLCRLERRAAKAGTILNLTGENEGITAEVVKMPVYDPERKRVRS